MAPLAKSSFHFVLSAKCMLCSLAPRSVLKEASVPSRTNTIRLTKLIQSDAIINQILQKNQIIKDNTWAIIRQDLLNRFSENSQLNAVIDAKICEICSYYNKFDEVKLYFKFLLHNNLLSLKFIETYLNLYHMKNQKIATEEEEKEILSICDEVRRQYPILDSRSASVCVMALTLTQKWRAALKLIDVVDTTTQPGATSVESIIRAAFRQNEPKIGWDLIIDRKTSSSISPNVYLVYLKYCQEHSKGNRLFSEIEKLFYIWQKNAIHPSKRIIEQFVHVLSALGCVANYTSISSVGCCDCCNHKLRPTTLSKDEFKVLSSEILKLIVLGQKMHHGASPQELKKYKVFLQSMRPYEVVIDGLNIAYEGKKDSRGSLSNILQLVDSLRSMGKKNILLIGRAHMDWWSKSKMDLIKNQVDVFLTKNLSEDDSFLLHVTMMSGFHTCFVSNDLMKEHKNKLPDAALRELFKRWQLSRQYRFKRLKKDSQPKLIPPLEYRMEAQESEDGWHLPYANSTGLRMSDEMKSPAGWLCLKTRKCRNS